MSSCHTVTDLPLKKEDKSEWIALVGNPNVGKSVVFQALTNIYVDVSNFPGTTLDISHGRCNGDLIIDTPGIYGISSFNDEEKVARDVILQADRVVNVVNAGNLERDLFLTQHLIDAGIPVIVVLNMIDEAKRNGIEINTDLLARKLGVPVLEAVATKKKGMGQLKSSIKLAKPGNATPYVQHLLDEQDLGCCPTQREKLLMLEGDEGIAQTAGGQSKDMLEPIYSARRDYIDSVISDVKKQTTKGARWGVKFGHWLLRPTIGFPFLVLMLYLMYKIIGVFVAGDIVGITEEEIMIGKYQPFIVDLFTDRLGISESGALGTILVGEFGLFTMTPIYVLGLLLPLVFSFYLFLSIFEDSGYLPRLAALVDRIMQKIGLNGKAIIPLILGFGCVTMATITTRILGSEREKRIAIFLLGLTIPCSAQLAVIVSLLGGLNFGYTILYGVIIFLVLAIVGSIMDSALKGKSSSLLIDIPPMRLPRPVNVMKKTVIKTTHFLKEATPLFAIGALLISVLEVTDLLDKIASVLKPITVNWLGLPAGASQAFIMGIVRRDFGAAGLSTMNITPLQTVVALITITLFVPCIASVLVLFKERVRKEAFIMWMSTFAIAFLTGGLFNQVMKVFSSYSLSVQFTGTLIIFVVFGFLVKIAAGLLLERGVRVGTDAQ